MLCMYEHVQILIDLITHALHVCACANFHNQYTHREVVPVGPYMGEATFTSEEGPGEASPAITGAHTNRAYW